ncbi:MAG: putative ABC transporter permease [Clostridia bacterium]|nr:putative ABC transporter permease [Clostridia bacterium]
MKNKISRYFIFFMLYAIIGWCYEVFLEVVIYKWGFSNRGVLFGPYCPVYGVGALAFIFTAGRIIKSKNLKEKILFIPIVFVLCMLIATAIELITSYLCEIVIGSWPWQTYSDYKYNFQARIALSPSIRFGLGGLIFLYILQPIFENICNFLESKKILNKLSIILMIVIFVDIIYTFIF